MAIDSVSQVKKASHFGSSGAVDDLDKSAQSPANRDPETKQTLDKASGLLQTIITDKISAKVIRKIPSDEYLHLLNLLDEIISGSIDKQV